MAGYTLSVSYATVAAPETPRVSENELLAPCGYHNEYFLSSVEQEHFYPAYFQSATFNDSSAVFGALKAQGFPKSLVCCLQ